MSRLRKSGKVAVACAAFVGCWEGLQTVAYPDPATQGPPWTVCYGSTRGVKKGDRYSIEDCKRMLTMELPEYAEPVEQCLKVPVTDERLIALVSLSYNVGPAAVCKSTAVRLINEGRTREGCDAFLLWNRAAGVVWRGLTRRREAERELCLKGVA